MVDTVEVRWGCEDCLYGCFLSQLLLYFWSGYCAGEDVNGMSFQGADEELLRRALGILEEQEKCTIFKGETSSEDGIKFR